MSNYHLKCADSKCSGETSRTEPSLVAYVVSTINSYEPPRDKTNKVVVRPAKTMISLGIAESSLSAWRKLGSLANHLTNRIVGKRMNIKKIKLLEGNFGDNAAQSGIMMQFGVKLSRSITAVWASSRENLSSGFVTR